MITYALLIGWPKIKEKQEFQVTLYLQLRMEAIIEFIPMEQNTIFKSGNLVSHLEMLHEIPTIKQYIQE